MLTLPEVKFEQMEYLKMTPEQYQKEAKYTEPDVEAYSFIADVRTDAELLRLLHHAIGICTEAGELQDQLKKHIFYEAKLDRVNLIEELGDLMWYIAGMCNALDVSLEKVMARNNAKLRARYGEKFSSERALNRDLDAEKNALSK